MTTLIQPETVAEVADAVRSTPRVLAEGGRTKGRMCESDAAKLSMGRLRGVVEYDPSEFTFTALAGTPVKEIAVALAERGQYLPFDPMLLESGSTLGGTIAAGLSGPGRFRFGGLRDFILAVQFVDGAGRLLRMGSKVVKNAAGFDLPKFFVGSLGRFGVLVELTFKVFPRPASTLTLKLPVGDIQSAGRILIEASCARWEPDALDLPNGGHAVFIRLAGPQSALEKISADILTRWPGEVVQAADASSLWAGFREFGWTHSGGAVYKVPLTPEMLTPFTEMMTGLEGARVHFSAGGNVAFLSLRSPVESNGLGERLQALGLSAVALRGNVPLWSGKRTRSAIEVAVKKTLDPENRFPSLED